MKSTKSIGVPRLRSARTDPWEVSYAVLHNPCLMDGTPCVDGLGAANVSCSAVTKAKGGLKCRVRKSASHQGR
jgi:hypothetical protein